MSVESTLVANVLKVKVSGRFVFNLHDRFRNVTKLAEHGVKQIVIDLDNTNYVDSSALGMLLLLRDKFTGDQNAIQIRNARKDVKKILEIAHFNKLFNLL